MTKETEKRLGLLGVPLGLGAGRKGSELGVSAIRSAGVGGVDLVTAMANLGYEVFDHGDIEVNPPKNVPKVGDSLRYLEEIVDVCRRSGTAVQAMMQKGHLPVILAGDHSNAIGTMSGMSSHFRVNDEELGVIWFDAHADINTPNTTLSGNVHGMPLAVLLGHGDERLVNLFGFSPKINRERFVHVGARDLDQGEREMVRSLGLRDRFFTMSDIDRHGMVSCMERAIEIATGGGEGKFAVTFDVDVIDPRFAPGSGTLVRGGITYREAHLCLEMVAETGLMTSFEIVEVNPLLDEKNITVELAGELILSALGKTII